MIIHCPVCISQGATIEETMGFEVVQDVWVTEADLSEFQVRDLLCELTTFYAKLRRGVEQSADFVKEGSYSCKWAKHTMYPTLATTNIPKDWSSYDALSLWIYSETATNQEVFLAVHSDNSATLWKDFFYTSFIIDWTGWKGLTFTFSEFSKYEEAVGWNKIDGVFFYTKAFNRQPNPYTVLYLDDMNSDTATGVEDQGSKPDVFRIGQNYPNPFNTVTTIPFHLPRPSAVKVEIYSLLGQRVALLADGYMTGGRHTVVFDAVDMASGIYLYTITVNGSKHDRQMMFLK